jgi:uncharacterized Ntn-hydrolase superfamily protein
MKRTWALTFVLAMLLLAPAGDSPRAVEPHAAAPHAAAPHAAAPHAAAPHAAAPHAAEGELIRTFSIAAVDPEAGVCGAAVASRYPAVGKVVAHARAGVGAFCTQHQGNPKWGTPALDLLEKGKLPEEVLAELLRDDASRERRQLAIIDMKGRAAFRHPVGAPKNSEYWGGMSGKYYTCQGNTLTGREVIVAMARAYEETKGSLADRLMAALVAADCAGGDHRGRLAAGIRVCKNGVDGYWLDLHTDKSKDAVIDLLRAYVELKHEAKGTWPGGQPPFKHPCPERPEPKRPNP